jgi:hypothetical protein
VAVCYCGKVPIHPQQHHYESQRFEVALIIIPTLKHAVKIETIYSLFDLVWYVSFAIAIIHFCTG